MRKIDSSIYMTAEAGSYADGEHAVRLVIRGLPSEEMAVRVADWVYALVDKNMETMLKECTPGDMKFVSSEKVREGRAGDEEEKVH